MKLSSQLLESINKKHPMLFEKACQKHCKDEFLKVVSSVIEDLQEELIQALNINQEYQEEIQIITKEKQFYQSQYNQNLHNKQLTNIKSLYSQTMTLATALKKANQDLISKIQIIQQENQQKDCIIQAMEKHMDRIEGEKRLVEKQFSKIHKAIQLQIKQKEIENEANNKENINQNQTMASHSVLTSKINGILKKINQKIALQQYQEIIFPQDLAEMNTNKKSKITIQHCFGTKNNQK